jgi:hypothetical protein
VAGLKRYVETMPAISIIPGASGEEMQAMIRLFGSRENGSLSARASREKLPGFEAVLGSRVEALAAAAQGMTTGGNTDKRVIADSSCFEILDPGSPKPI